MIEHLSLSSVKTYLNCPKLFWFQYVEKVPVAKSPWAVFGMAIHNTFEHYIWDLSLSGESVSPTDRWLVEWTNAKAEEEPIDWNRANPDSLYYAGLRVCANASIVGYIAQMRALVQNGEPLIETFFKFDLDGVGVPVLGYIDIVTDDGIPGDFKTAKRPWTQEQAQRELQPLVYLMGLHALGLDVPYGRFRHYVIPSDGYGGLQVLEATHTPERIAQMADIIRGAWTGIAAACFHRNPTYQWCGRFCPYLELCQP